MLPKRLSVNLLIIRFSGQTFPTFIVLGFSGTRASAAIAMSTTAFVLTNVDEPTRIRCSSKTSRGVMVDQFVHGRFVSSQGVLAVYYIVYWIYNK